jgi:hypothetical protein
MAIDCSYKYGDHLISVRITLDKSKLYIDGNMIDSSGNIMGRGSLLRGAINPEPGGTQHHVVEVKRRFLFMTPRVFVDGAELERIK